MLIDYSHRNQLKYRVFLDRGKMMYTRKTDKGKPYQGGNITIFNNTWDNHK